MPTPPDAEDMARAFEPLPVVEGETSTDREARLLAHIGRHLTGRDLALRTEFRREIARLDDHGAKMDAALHHLSQDFATEQRAREEADRELAAEQREVPRLMLGMKDDLLKMKSEIITAVQTGHGAPPRAEGPHEPQPPTVATLIQTSWPMRALVFAFALFLAASSVGVLALAIGSDRAGDVATNVVDKLPHYPTPAPQPARQPAPGASPEPQP